MFSKKSLAITASIIWLMAGLSVLFTGLMHWEPVGDHPFFKVGLALLSTVAFGRYILPPVVRRNVFEIKALLGNQLPLYRCFSLRTWMVVGVMMSAGVFFRTAGFVPSFVIAGFYTGLGIGLLLASMMYYKVLSTTSLDKNDRSHNV